MRSHITKEEHTRSFSIITDYDLTEIMLAATKYKIEGIVIQKIADAIAAPIIKIVVPAVLKAMEEVKENK
ncbi:MAG TPA: hypothetical protein ENI23_06240 [bacterium]|nr:hypothetical protein [bacterium]